MIQAMNFGRGVLLSVFGIDSNTFGQRAHRGENALGFGLAKPAFVNAYGEFDLLALWLTAMIVHLLKIDLKLAAELVRAHWLGLLKGIAIQERLKSGTPYSGGVCFVIASDSKGKIQVGIGPCERVINEIGGADMVPLAIPLDLVLRQVRYAAESAGLTLPKKFTPGPPESAEFKRWLKDVEVYRKVASMKGTTRVSP